MRPAVPLGRELRYRHAGVTVVVDPAGRILALDLGGCLADGELLAAALRGAQEKAWHAAREKARRQSPRGPG